MLMRDSKVFRYPKEQELALFFFAIQVSHRDKPTTSHKQHQFVAKVEKVATIMSEKKNMSQPHQKYFLVTIISSPFGVNLLTPLFSKKAK